MSKLDELAGKRDQILLAEIAGLLHNIGKLDANFLAEKVKGNTQQELEEHHSDIPDYYFDRFAAPDVNLLATARKVISEQKWDSRAELAAALESEFEDPSDCAAVHILSHDWKATKKDYPFVAQVIEAAWQFNRFSFGNGPLYRHLVSQRETAKRKLTEIEQRLESSGQELVRVRRDLGKAAPGDKKALGMRKGELESQITEAEKEHKQVWGTLIGKEREQQAQCEEQFRSIALSVAGESWPLADLLALFWDSFFYQPPDDPDSGYKRRSTLAQWLAPGHSTRLPALLIISHGEMSGGEKKILLLDKDDKEIKASPSTEDLAFATAFGYDRAKLDVWSLQSRRFDLIKAALVACAAPADQRATFVLKARDVLRHGLGDTQWPINEINLWDYASTITALFKSGVARAVLEGEIPTVGDMHWRFLSLRFDGLGYLSQAHHVTDLLGRRETLNAALNAAQELLEETYPLGNQVYRDENGVVFVAPDLPGQDILDMTGEKGDTLKTLLERAFARAEEKENRGAALAGELTPDLRVGPKVRGKQLELGDYLSAETCPLTADAAKMAEWWRSEQAEGKEICTVCGARPVGWGVDRIYAGRDVKHYREQADGRKICGVCIKRRGRRAQEWARGGLDATIWTDEVADANGRFALVVGHFALEGWLDGTLIPTMQKPASFARVRRCWETTRGFWTQVEKDVVPAAVNRWQGENGQYQKKSPRLVIKIENKRDLSKKLGAYYTYEIVVDGRQVSLVWDAEHSDLISAENLRYLGQQLGLKRKIWQAGNDDELLKELKQRIEKASPLSLYEPSEYGQTAKPLEGVEVKVERVDVGDPRYVPHIPLLTEPALFMALVPADRAMDVVHAIKQKYEREMSKVRDRLPLHLGVLIAPRRTPLRAVLEAGQAMLKAGARGWEEWQVAQAPVKKTGAEAPRYLTENNRHFEAWWEVSLQKGERKIHLRIGAVMGDGDTPDQWHSHLLTREPKAEGENFGDKPWKRPAELEAGDNVWIAPSTFDFEFLDTTARRFEIAYNQTGQRRGRPTRPYLLEEIETLQQVWDLLNQRLHTTQWMALDGLIEKKRREWNEPRGASEQYSDTFKQFVEDTLYNAEWKRRPDEKEFALLKDAAQWGVLNDVIDLYHEAIKEKGEN